MNQSPQSLVDAITYQESAVVSKEIIKTPGATITLFAFDRGQGLSEHQTPFDALVQILDGQAVITIDGQSQSVSAGQALIMPANHPHALQADQPFKMLLTMAR